jgi:GT2 family glycosyltransferase
MDLHPSVTIVIPNYNGAKLLRENLPYVKRALETYPGEGKIIVVDDGSSDDSLDVLRTEFSDVITVVHEKNQGFSEAVHSGVRAAEDEVLILLNSDVQPEAGFIAPLADRMRSEAVFSVQSAIKFDSPVVDPYCLSRYAFRWGALKRLPTPDLGRDPWLCLFASGGSMAVSRSKFLELEGFLPLLKPFYWEDFDIGLRAWRRGWETWLEPSSVVLHQEHGSIRDHYKKKRIRWALQRNKLLVEWIHFPLIYLILTSPPRVLIRLIFRVVTGDFGYFSVIGSALSRLSEVRRIRKEIATTGTLSFLSVIETIAHENRGHTELDRSGSKGCCGS